MSVLRQKILVQAGQQNMLQIPVKRRYVWARTVFLYECEESVAYTNPLWALIMSLTHRGFLGFFFFFKHPPAQLAKWSQLLIRATACTLMMHDSQGALEQLALKAFDLQQREQLKRTKTLVRIYRTRQQWTKCLMPNPPESSPLKSIIKGNKTCPSITTS